MSEQETERRVEDSALRVEIRALNENVRRLTETVDENTKQLARLAVLESNFTHHGDSIERAFSEIASVKAGVADTLETHAQKIGNHDRWVYTVSGFVAAISVMWTVVGYRLNAVIDDQMKAVAEMRLHIHDDKVTTPEQVKAIMLGVRERGTP